LPAQGLQINIDGTRYTLDTAPSPLVILSSGLSYTQMLWMGLKMEAAYLPG